MPSSRTVIEDRAPLDDEDIGLGGIVAALLRRWLTALFVFLVAIAIGVAIILFSAPRYTASTTILLDPRLGKIVGVDPSTPGFVADSSTIDSQLKLLTSQTVLSHVATTLHLDQAPEFSGSKFSLSRLFGAAPASETGADLKALENAITIKRPERTYLVEISASAATPDRAAAIANGVAEAYNADQISSRVVGARNDARFVREKREQLRKQIEDADRRIEAYKSANNIVSTDGLRSNEQQVADLTRELGTARGRVSELKARADQIAAIVRSGRFDASADALKSAAIERLRGSQADAERELAKLSQTLGPRHPAVQEAQAQVQRVRELIGAELGRLRQSADIDYRTETRNEAQLVTELDRIKRQATNSSSKLVPLRQMEREVDALRASDERFARISDTLTQQEADTPPARVISQARPPVSPSWPRRSLILGIAGAVGAFFGLGAALLRDGVSRPLLRRRTTIVTEADPHAVSARNYWDGARVAEVDPEPEEVIAPRSVVTRAAKVQTTAEVDDEDDYYRGLRLRKRPARRMVWS